MELKGVKPGEFRPRCTACKDKFRLVIHADPSQPPSVSAEVDHSAETISPAIAQAMGVPQEQARQSQQSPRAKSIASPASTRATMAPAAVGSPSRAAPQNARSNIAATSVAPAEAPVQQSQINRSRQMPSQIDHAPPYDEEPILPGQTLGGYEIRQKLGQGGMGAVYLARQVSLDRNVALKVLAPNLASDPQFVARFTREAYAAAQLSHHNVVQIHDIGAERSINFFSMEFVEGQTLSSLVAENGKVDVEQAVGFILQAGRGLKYAHDHGLIHRDIKPENLLLNDAGIVKVADLGLVKRANSSDTLVTQPGNAHGANKATAPDRTQLNMSMGTPAYMSPEQGQDAAHVDHRADIYSLGCTMYDLLTGRPPFTGNTALEVITKHQREAIVPPDAVVKNIPRTLSVILLKMVAKKPEQRYQTMSEVITALEDFLGVATTGPFQPKEEHVKVLEFAVERFNNSIWSKVRFACIGMFFLLCAALAIFIGMTRPTVLSKIQFTGAFIGLATLTTVAYTFIAGQMLKTPLFLRLRQLIFGAKIFDFVVWTVGLILIVALLAVFKQLLGWSITSGIACLLASAFYFTIDLALSRDRNTPIIQVEAMLKQMRLRGLDENSLRQFVSKYSGRRWEEFYEALFGYDAMIQARQLWGRDQRGQPRPRFAKWRDPIIRAIESRLAHRREERERRVLMRVEAKAMRAKGINETLALKQARANARRMVTRAEELRSSKMQRAAATMLPETQIAGSAIRSQPTSVMLNKDVALEGAIASMLRGGTMQGGSAKSAATEQTDEEYERTHESWFKRRYGTPLDLICGPLVRFLLAVIVLLLFTVWFKQNSGEQAAREAADVLNHKREVDITSQVSDLKRKAIDTGNALKESATVVAAKTSDKPLALFPESWATLNNFCVPFGGWNAGLAGALLLISAFFNGRLLALTVVCAAVVAMGGHHLSLPFTIYAWMSAAAAVLIWIFGVMFFRVQEGF